MPNLPASLDFPRVQDDKDDVKAVWAFFHLFFKVMQRQWTMLVQAVNPLLKCTTSTSRATLPALDECLYYETDTGLTYIATGGVWVLFTGQTGAVTSTTSDTTVAVGTSLLLVDATSGARAVTVNNSSSLIGRTVTVKKVDGSVNAVVVWPSSGQLEFSTSRILGTIGSSVTMTSNGTDLFITAVV